MSRKNGDTIYRRPKAGFEERDPDNWEDFIVCDAYDKAVKASFTSKTYHCMYDRKETEAHSKNVESGHKSHGKAKPWGTRLCEDQNAPRMKSQADSYNSKPPPRTSPGNVDVCKWKPGDQCVALYREDGLFYNCRILSVDNAAGSCLVEYDGYGNTEVVDITNIMAEDGTREPKQRTPDTTSSSALSNSTSAGSSTDGTSSDVTQDIYKNRSKKKKRSEEAKHGHSWDNLSSMAPPNFNFNPLFAMPPPMFMTQGLSSELYSRRNNANCQQNLHKLRDLSDDALSSMLMSWYMAGYHTGYYQGISSRNSKKTKK